jgi:hypothetical protein
MVQYPYGPDATGYLMYSADGYMSAVVMSANRPSFAAGDLLVGSVEERAAAAASYISYAGPYEDQAGKVVHHVKVSLFPNWLGGDQERFYEVVGNRLSISTPPMLLAGREQRSYLIWERAVPEA